jgi:cbb3-type cytochrome oxidase subunit 3
MRSGERNMHDFYAWASFLGAPLFLLAMTVFTFRPSRREQYREAKHVIFADEN